MKLALIFVAAFVFSIASVGQAALVLSVGETIASFRQAFNWAPARYEHSGQVYMANPSNNGVVLRYPDIGFAGGTHGYESLERVDLWVDGINRSVSDTVTYTGNVAVLTRTTVLNESVRMTHVSTVTSAGIDEAFVLDGFDPTKTIERMFILGSRENRLTDWTALAAVGTVLGMGRTDADDSSTDYMPGSTREVRQYDPLLGNGIITRWSMPPENAPGSYIWDRGAPEGGPDNKLYQSLGGPLGPADKMTFLTQSIRFFDLLPGDANADGRVNLADFGLFKAGFGKPDATWQSGDFDHSGAVNLADFGILKNSFGGTTSAVPEPSSLFCLSIGLLSLLALRRR